MLQSKEMDNKFKVPEGWASIADDAFFRAVEVGLVYDSLFNIPASAAFTFLFSPENIDKQLKFISMLSDMHEGANDRCQI